MRNVLVIAYYFPPIGGGGVQRTSKHVKYLRDNGYNPIVLTVNPRCVRKIKDPKLLDDIPEGTTVYRTATLDADWLFKLLYGLRLKKLVRWMVQNVFVPDIQILWIPFALRKLKTIFKRHNIDLIYVTGTPFSSFFIGIKAKKRYHLPLFVDFRDEWTYHGEYLDHLPAPSVQRREMRMEEEVLRNADMMAVVVQEVKNNFVERYPFLQDIPIGLIPNGYDEEDFANQKPGNAKKEYFHLVFSGTLYGKRRNAGILLQAIRELIAEGEIAKERIRMDIYGKNTAANFLKRGDEAFAKVHGYLSHREVIQRTLEADILVLLVNPGPNCLPDYPGKISEYLRTGRPILAIVPAGGSAADVIEKTRTGFVANSANLEEVKKTLLDCYRKWESGTLEIDPDWDKIKRYERREMTRRLAGMFNRFFAEGR